MNPASAGSAVWPAGSGGRLVGSRGAKRRTQDVRAAVAPRHVTTCPSVCTVCTVCTVRPGIGLHPAVPAQRTPRRQHRQRAVRAGRSRPRQRLRRGDDQRAPRWLRGLHGTTAADGFLRPGRACEGVGRRCATPAPTPVHRARSPRRWRGCRPAIPVGWDSGWPRAPYRWTSRRPASARPRRSSASRRSSRGSSPCSAVRTWTGSRGTPPWSPAGGPRSPCSARPSRWPPRPGRPGAARAS